MRRDISHCLQIDLYASNHCSSRVFSFLKPTSLFTWGSLLFSTTTIYPRLEDPRQACENISSVGDISTHLFRVSPPKQTRPTNCREAKLAKRGPTLPLTLIRAVQINNMPYLFYVSCVTGGIKSANATAWQINGTGSATRHL